MRIEYGFPLGLQARGAFQIIVINFNEWILTWNSIAKKY